jgi:hypothetical protein
MQPQQAKNFYMIVLVSVNHFTAKLNPTSYLMKSKEAMMLSFTVLITPKYYIFLSNIVSVNLFMVEFGVIY